MNDGLNYEAWARNAIAFIRERGLEGEFSDWCGGWPVPVKATAPMIAAAPLLLEALEGLVRAVNTNELAAAMACHSVTSFANVEDALKPARAAISSARGGQ